MDFKELAIPVRTIDHINTLEPFLPAKHSPLKSQSGFANESYLFDISQDFALALAHLLDGWVVALVQGNYMMEMSRDRSYENLVEWEDRVEEQISTDNNINETERPLWCWPVAAKASIGTDC